MAFSVVMPALELTQESGKLVAWRKKEGERVTKGEPLLEVETDKAVVEIEAPAEGILGGVKAREGAVVPVGETIAWILEPGEILPAEAPPSPATRQAVAATSRDELRALAPSPASGTRISPKARRLARGHGIDVSGVRGSGADGEILVSDVEALLGSRQPALAPASLEQSQAGRPSSVARLMAERTTQSWTTVPHFFVVRDMDAGALIQARAQMRSKSESAQGARPTYTDFLVALVARVLVRHPALNASWTSGAIHVHREVNIGVAVALQDGVVAAVIHNADRASLADITVQNRELAERARAGRLHPADITGATFTISNLGMYHVTAFSAIIAPPQAAILAVGSISDRVVALGGQPAVRPMMTLTLSCDHRVVDGAKAAAFLDGVADAVRAFPQCLE